ncbi:MAG: hypothetical protein ACE5IR_20290 [bacterium]
MLDILNSLLNSVFGVLFFLFKKLDPFWGMLVISLVTGIVMLFVFKATSDQKGIKRAKNLVKGHFLAIRLYRDDIGLMFDTMKNIILSNLFYLSKSFRPMLFLLVPVSLILIQLGSRYEWRPFKVGETIIVSLNLADAGADVDLSRVELALPTGLKIDIPPVRINDPKEINWRMTALEPGEYDLTFKYDDRTVSKRLYVEGDLISIASNIGRSFSVTLMNPGEKSIPKPSFASAIAVRYPKRDFHLFGFEVHWLVAFFVLSLIAAFSFKGFLGVEV